MIMKVIDGDDGDFAPQPVDAPFDFHSHGLPGHGWPGPDPLAAFAWPARLLRVDRCGVDVPDNVQTAPHSEGTKLRFANVRALQDPAGS